jgi:hypothetical protein
MGLARLAILTVAMGIASVHAESLDGITMARRCRLLKNPGGDARGFYR